MKPNSLRGRGERASRCAVTVGASDSAYSGGSWSGGNKSSGLTAPKSGLSEPWEDHNGLGTTQDELESPWSDIFFYLSSFTAVRVARGRARL